MINQIPTQGRVVPILASAAIVIGLTTGGVAVWLGFSGTDGNVETATGQAVPNTDRPSMTTTTPPTPATGAANVSSEPGPDDDPTSRQSPIGADPAKVLQPSRFVFPVKSPDARYDRGHHDYPAADMFAQCGSPVLAVTDGTVEEVETVDTWDSSNPGGGTKSGLMVALVDSRGVRYYGSHMASISVGVGDVLAAGDQIGTVGETGNAAGTGCHLHFGLSPVCLTGWEHRRGHVPPQPFLDAWRTGQALDPLEEVMAIPCT